MFKFKQANNPLGLDMSGMSLKLVQLTGRGDNLNVQAYADLPVPKEVFSEDIIKDSALLVRTIKKALAIPHFGKFTTTDVVASIPEIKSFVRVIQMPEVSEEEAAEAIPWEAEAYFPMPISQVYLDWMILPHTAVSVGPTNQTEVTGKKMTVLIIASPRDYVDDFTRVLKEAGLRPLALEVESQATARSLVSRADETVLIMDINTLRTSMIIYDKDTLEFTSSIPVAGKIFTDSISRSLGVSFEEAEKLKRKYGLDEAAEKGMPRKALIPVLNNLLGEVKNTMRFFEEHAPADTKISRLLLCGGSSKLKHLPSFLHDQFTHSESPEHPLRSLPGMKVELANPWIKVLKKKQTPPMSREDSLSYATAIGLALRETEA